MIFLVLLLILVALVVPLIPMRKRRHGIEGVPLVTIALLAANIVIFCGTMEDNELSRSVAETWGLRPVASSLPLLLTQLFTHMFLHAGWSHLIGNMLGLWLFGSHVEEALGRLTYTLFYVGCGVAAGLMHVLIADTLLHSASTVPMVGASGAIFGVMGLFAVRFWRTKVRVFLVFQIPAIWAVGAFALLQVIFGFQSIANGGASDNTANWAHIGGFLFGMLIAVPLRMREDSRVEYRLEDAQQAVATGRLDVGAAHYREMLHDKPDDAEAHVALARVCVQQRQAEGAHRHYTDGMRLLLQGGNPTEAAEVYEEACRTFEFFPIEPALLQRIAGACEQTHRYSLAQRALTEICRDHAESNEAEMALLRLGKLHLQKLNQPESAVGVFSEFLRLYPMSEWVGHAEHLLDDAQKLATRYHPVPASPL